MQNDGKQTSEGSDAMNARGHNETPFRLDALAVDARRGLERVAAGEDETLEGWLAYGAALNEGRALFPGDREFGEWVAHSQLDRADYMDRAAAMWAAANAEQFEEARAAGKARTVRGIHAKWKEIEAEREKVEAEARRKAEADAKAAQTDDDDQIGATPDALPEATTAPDPVRKTSDTSDADKAGTSAGKPLADGPAPDKAPGPWRKGLTGLTREGLEDEVAGLREENAELRAERDALISERDKLRTQVAELSEGNQGAVISRLQKQVGAATYKRDEALRAAKRMEYRMKQAQKEAEIPL